MVKHHKHRNLPEENSSELQTLASYLQGQLPDVRVTLNIEDSSIELSCVYETGTTLSPPFKDIKICIRRDAADLIIYDLVLEIKDEVTDEYTISPIPNQVITPKLAHEFAINQMKAKQCVNGENASSYITFNMPALITLDDYSYAYDHNLGFANKEKRVKNLKIGSAYAFQLVEPYFAGAVTRD